MRYAILALLMLSAGCGDVDASAETAECLTPDPCTIAGVEECFPVETECVQQLTQQDLDYATERGKILARSEGFGELQDCDFFNPGAEFLSNGEYAESLYVDHVWELIPTTPGEVFALTLCSPYEVTDGVYNVPSSLSTRTVFPISPTPVLPGCTTYEVVAEDDVYWQLCREDLDASDSPLWLAALGVTIVQRGFGSVYVRRVGTP